MTDAPNVLRLPLPTIPPERRRFPSVDFRNLPPGVVALHPPRMAPEPEPVRLSAEMEVIHHLIKVLDTRTKSGRRSAAKVRDRLLEELFNTYGDSKEGTNRQWATKRGIEKLCDARLLDRGHAESAEA